MGLCKLNPEMRVDMAQQETATEYDRYPDVFRTAQIYAGSHFGDKPLRILSFGCSYGLEMATLRAYFPTASIFGCDVSEDAMRRAALLPGACVFRSTGEAIAAFGPFDMIFAMSVLCRFTLSRKSNTITDVFPFSEFEAHLSVLDGALAPGGLLCVYNSNYLFRQSRFAAGYAPVRSALIGSNGFVDKWLADGRRISSAVKLRNGREHALVDAAREVVDDDFRDAIFQKGAPEPIVVSPAQFPSGDDLFVRESGSDLGASLSAARVAQRLREIVRQDAVGGVWTGRQWLKSGVRGAIIELPVWWSRGEPATVGLLSDLQRPYVITEKPARKSRLSRLFTSMFR
jgi:hypothetical protein